MEPEEWDEEAENFFSEFSENTSNIKSKRKLQREADQFEKEKSDVEKKKNKQFFVEEARQKIASAVLRNASKKDLEKIKKQQKNKKNSPGASVPLPPTPSNVGGVFSKRKGGNRSDKRKSKQARRGNPSGRSKFSKKKR